MGADPGAIAGQFAQTKRRALRLVPAVGEDQCRCMPGHLLKEKLVRTGPECGIARLQEVPQRGHHLHVEVLAHPGVNNGAWSASAPVVVPDKKARDVPQWPQRCGTPNPLQRPFHPGRQSFQADRQVNATLVVAQGMNLVHYHRAHGPQGLVHPLAAKKQVQ